MTITSLVYIIILNWNGWQDTVECVESCRSLTYPAFRILIVDNGSTDGSEEKLRQAYPELEFIQTGANLGFAGGNNVGIKYALDQGAEYIWLLNNDTIVAPNALSELVKVVESDDRIGVVGSKLYYYDEPRLIAFAGGFWTETPLYPKHRGVDEVDQGQYDSVEDVDFISGCSLLIKSTVIRDVGEMSPAFFLYWEDIDWNASVSKHGWRIVFVPTSSVWHKVSASTNSQPGLKICYSVRNRLLFLKRHRRGLLLSAFLRAVMICLRYALKGQTRTAMLYFKGLKDFALGRFGQMS